MQGNMRFSICWGGHPLPAPEKEMHRGLQLSGRGRRSREGSCHFQWVRLVVEVALDGAESNAKGCPFALTRPARLILEAWQTPYFAQEADA